jgi:type I restriction enzyme R subunit
MPPTPEYLARQSIDAQLTACSWTVQDRTAMNLYASRGVAVREFPVAAGFADYMLFVDRKAVGVVEAKKVGMTLSGVAEQAGTYAAGLPTNIPHAGTEKLPFVYESTGVETFFRDERDPEPRSRRLFTFHRPEILAEWANPVGVDGVHPDDGGNPPDARRASLQTIRGRLREMPGAYPLNTTGLWGAQVEAITNLEKSFVQDKPRALIQMATGSGKTYTAVSFVYRLIKFAKARRVLFLVDRNNLGRQAFKEFDQYRTPDDGRKFTELYNVQHLQSNTLDPVSKVHITTIQRLFSMLSGEPEYDPQNEENSLFDMGAALDAQPPREVHYNPSIPIETYDFIVVDECHRSIYNLWRGVLEYFDAFLIGLTATPSKQTFGFFNQNLVMEYSRQRAVADGVNVDGQVYRIRTQISEAGAQVEAGLWVGKRDRLTRAQRWEQLDEDLSYEPEQLDRAVVAVDQIRTIVRTFRDRLPVDIFPGRTLVPKTLVFAKDDSHAEDIVRILREEFGKGDEFCQKITYKVNWKKPEDLISDFRNSYFPRIAVTVDMIATGTDIRPLEILLFMRAVRSRLLYEQMLGRGTRVVSPTELQNVTSDALLKDHFVIVDAVGLTEQELMDPQTLERKPSATFKQLLEAVALGVSDEATLSSLAGRLIRLEKHLDRGQLAEVKEAAGGASLSDIARGLLEASDPDRILETARCRGAGPAPDYEGRPDEEEIKKTAHELAETACRPLAANPNFRNRLVDWHTRSEQMIDETSVDDLIGVGFDDRATEAAQRTVDSFQQFIEEHKDEITALQIIYSIPRRGAWHAPTGSAPGTRSGVASETGQTMAGKGQTPSAPTTARTPSAPTLTFEGLRELAERLRLDLQQPDPLYMTQALWEAYRRLEKGRVRGSGVRVLSDLVSLVRHVALNEDIEPYPMLVQRRYVEWLGAQEMGGRTFTPEQRWWLDQIAAHIGINLEITAEDFTAGAFFQRGGQVAAMRAFGGELLPVINELNEVLGGK